MRAGAKRNRKPNGWRWPRGKQPKAINPDIPCMTWNICPEGRCGLISSGLPGLTPSEKWKNHVVFPFFPVGRAKFLSKRNLDAAHISPGEICGLKVEH
jgi:hypothetical protein